MTPCIGPYSPVAAIKAKSVENAPARSVDPDSHTRRETPRPACSLPWFGMRSRPSSELRTAVPTQADGRSTGVPRRWYAGWYAEGLDSPRLVGVAFSVATGPGPGKAHRTKRERSPPLFGATSASS